MTGLHGRAERGPHGVTVYLLPGLTACQRRAVLRRLRQEASRYVGPALPLPQLAIALGLDRIRSAVKIAGAIVRLHPAVTLLPGALVAALMSLFVIASADGPDLGTGQQPGRAARGISTVSLARRSVTWYACSPAVNGPVLAPIPGQPACWRPVSLLVPYTDHLPGPQAFAT